MILNSALFPVNGEDQDSLVASKFGDIRVTHHLGQISPFASREETPFLLEDKKKEPRGNCLSAKFDLAERAHLGPADSANPGYRIRPLARHRPLSKPDGNRSKFRSRILGKFSARALPFRTWPWPRCLAPLPQPLLQSTLFGA